MLSETEVSFRKNKTQRKKERPMTPTAHWKIQSHSNTMSENKLDEVDVEKKSA